MHVIIDMEIEPKDEPQEEAVPWTDKDTTPPQMLAWLFSLLADQTKHSEQTAWRVRSLDVVDVL